MKTQPNPSDREVLAGLVERVTYHNVENGFCVLRAKARGHRDIVTVVGRAATIAAGEWITASGEWVNDRTHGSGLRKNEAPPLMVGQAAPLGGNRGESEAPVRFPKRRQGVVSSCAESHLSRPLPSYRGGRQAAGAILREMARRSHATRTAWRYSTET
jgi:hypothetical protein